MKRALVTGASGFIGQSLCKELVKQGIEVFALARKPNDCPEGVKPVQQLDITQAFDMPKVDIVFHLAALAHRSNCKEDEYHKVNVIGTKNILLRAAEAKINRFIYVSSIKVHGECSNNQPFKENDTTCPQDNYGKSKLQAEELVRESSLRHVIVRPPLVYGPGVKGNMQRLIKLCDSPLPLPFAGIFNKRSFIALDNLLSVLQLCAKHPDAIGKTYLVRDGEDLSTTKLVTMIREQLHRPLRLFHIPARFLGERLSGTLQIDDSKIREELGWAPFISVTDAFARTCQR